MSAVPHYKGWLLSLRALGSRTKDGLVDLAVAAVASAGGAALAFAANVIIARDLGVNGYGTYVTIVSASMVLGSLATYGMGPLITREIAAHLRDSSSDVLRTLSTWALRLTASLALCGCVVVIIWLTFLPAAPASTWSMRLAGALIVPIYAGTNLAASALAGAHRVGASQIVSSTLRNAALLGGGAALLFIGVGSVVAMVWLQVVVTFFALVIGILWCRHWIVSRVVVPRFFVGLDVFRADLAPESWRKTARHFFVISLATLALFRLDVVIVNTVAGTAEAGLFGAAARIGQLAQLVGLVWMAWLCPRMADASAGAQHARLASLLRWGTAGSALMTLVPIALGWAFAPELLSLMGRGFSAAVWPLRWLLLSWLPWAASVPAYAFLSMSGSERVVSRALWLQVLLVLCAGVPLIEVAGANGGAWAWLGANVIGAAVVVMLAHRAYKRSLRQCQSKGKANVGT